MKLFFLHLIFSVTIILNQEPLDVLFILEGNQGFRTEKIDSIRMSFKKRIREKPVNLIEQKEIDKLKIATFSVLEAAKIYQADYVLIVRIGQEADEYLLEYTDIIPGEETKGKKWEYIDGKKNDLNTIISRILLKTIDNKLLSSSLFKLSATPIFLYINRLGQDRSGFQFESSVDLKSESVLFGFQGKIGSLMKGWDFHLLKYLDNGFSKPYIGLHLGSANFWLNDNYFQVIPKFGFEFYESIVLETRLAFTRNPSSDFYFMIGFGFNAEKFSNKN